MNNLLKRTLLSFLVIMFLFNSFIGFGTGNFNNRVYAYELSEIVTFEDSKLEAIIREQISKQEGDITYADIAGITELAVGSEVASLKGLEYLTGLKKLYIGSISREEDFSTICELKGLTHINISGFKLDSLNGIEKLSSLKNITILSTYGKPKDLSALALMNANTLESINLNTPYTILEIPEFDCSLLSNQKSLRSLQIIGFDVINSACIEELTNLTTVEFTRNKLSDYGFLSKLPKLQFVNIVNNPVASIPDLSNTDIYYLNIQNCGLTSTDGLGSSDTLKLLFLGENKITDISSINEKFPNIEALVISYNPIGDISPLADLNRIKSLQMSQVKGVDFNHLSKLTNLEELTLGSCDIKDIDFLSGLSKLVFLDLSYNNLDDNDLYPLSDLKSLRSLSLTDNKIIDFNKLKASLPSYSVTLQLWGYQGYPYDDVFSAMQYRRDKIIQRINENCSTELEKLHYIYELVKKSFVYDDNSKSHIFNLVYGDTAFCVTYSRAIKALLDTLGIENYMLSGANHTWNVVKIDGSYYHIDATWDDYYNQDDYDFF